MRIVVDQDTCIGAASCVIVAGKTFALNGEGKVYILNEDKARSSIGAMGDVAEAEMTEGMDDRETIIEAARSCPVLAIKLLEDDGTEIAL